MGFGCLFCLDCCWENARVARFQQGSCTFGTGFQGLYIYIYIYIFLVTFLHNIEEGYVIADNFWLCLVLVHLTVLTRYNLSLWLKKCKQLAKASRRLSRNSPQQRMMVLYPWASGRYLSIKLCCIRYPVGKFADCT